jgi:two-component system, OmpR family, phosphate regulon sensor histidine kinase PhoR
MSIALVVIAILAVGTMLFQARLFARREAELLRALETLGDDDASVVGGGMGRALHDAEVRLNQRLEQVREEGEDLDALVAALAEGVILCSRGGKILRVNRAAAKFLGLDVPRAATGLSVDEAIHNLEIRKFVLSACTQVQPLEGEVALSDPDRIMHLYSQPLYVRGIESGVLLVMTDISRLRHLETVRRDFVANVSHELKTPITSIQGFAETMLDQKVEHQDREGFIRIIATQAGRMNAIIEDLLTLARLEHQGEQRSIELEVGALLPVIDAALQICEKKRAEKGIQVRVQCVPECSAYINAPLLEQAVVNLLNNAITYSERGAEVQIEVRAAEGQVTIAVKDCGCGIAAEHLPRLFERFYRVDPGRSRKQGGTGLGLAIVKHIVESHGGSVGVESEPGKGSTFKLSVRSR